MQADPNAVAPPLPFRGGVLGFWAVSRTHCAHSGGSLEAYFFSFAKSKSGGSGLLAFKPSPLTALIKSYSPAGQQPAAYILEPLLKPPVKCMVQNETRGFSFRKNSARWQARKNLGWVFNVLSIYFSSKKQRKSRTDSSGTNYIVNELVRIGYLLPNSYI
jgi:hypothetical protein